MSALRDRHDRATRLELWKQKKWALENLDLLPNVYAAGNALWEGWEPVGVFDVARTAYPSDILWVFREPEHGWAAMLLPGAHDRWNANRVDALILALDLSASGPDLTTVCTRLLAERRVANSWNSQAVALLVTRPALQAELLAQNVEFFLALTAQTGTLVETAAFCGYGIPFQS